MDWIKIKDEVPYIDEDHSRPELPFYVILEDGTKTIAEYTRSKFIDGCEWISMKYDPIWICQDRNLDLYKEEVNVKCWFPVPN